MYGIFYRKTYFNILQQLFPILKSHFKKKHFDFNFVSWQKPVLMQSSRLKNWRQRHNSSRTIISLSPSAYHPDTHTHTHTLTQCLGANKSWALSNVVDLKNLLFLSHSLSLPPRHSLSHTHTHTHNTPNDLNSINSQNCLSLSLHHLPPRHTHSHTLDG